MDQVIPIVSADEVVQKNGVISLPLPWSTTTAIFIGLALSLSLHHLSLLESWKVGKLWSY